VYCEIWIRLGTHIIIQPVKGTGLEHRHEGLRFFNLRLKWRGSGLYNQSYVVRARHSISG